MQRSSKTELKKGGKTTERDSDVTDIIKLASMLVTQSCPTLCHPMDSSPSGSSVHGILQARLLEWVAIPFSKRSS